MIVRDEAAFLPGCLASLEGLADEVIIVDTGSTDQTVELACASGATVLHQEWQDDFSAPRSLAAQHARGEWILVLDADERIHPQGHQALRKALQAADRQFDIVLLPLYNADRLDASMDAVISGENQLMPPQLLPRIFRNIDNIRWNRRVHEGPHEWMNHTQRTARPLKNVPIVHYGAVPSHRKAQNKNVRNRRLLELDCAQHPEDHGARRHLAYEYLSEGDHQSAKREVAKAYATIRTLTEDNRPGARRPLSVAIVTLHAHYLQQEGKLLEALEALSFSLALSRGGLDENHPNLTYQQGQIYEALATQATEPKLGLGYLRDAEQAYRNCIIKHGSFLSEALNPPQCTGSAGWRRLGAVLLKLEQFESARHAFEEAHKLDPSDASAQLGLAEALIELNEVELALQMLHSMDEHQSSPDTLTLLALAYDRAHDSIHVLAHARRALIARRSLPMQEHHRMHKLQRVCQQHAHGPLQPVQVRQ